MVPLLLCSIVAVAVIVHRAMSLRTSLVMPHELVKALDTGDEAGVKASLECGSSTLGHICQTALYGRHRDRAAATESAEARSREEVVRLQSGLTTLEVIITIAPLLGLLGTVSGLVTVFSGLGTGNEEAAPSGSSIARGIAEALNTTIVGLSVAVPAVIAHGYFQRRIERLATRIENILVRALDWRFG